MFTIDLVYWYLIVKLLLLDKDTIWYTKCLVN